LFDFHIEKAGMSTLDFTRTMKAKHDTRYAVVGFVREIREELSEWKYQQVVPPLIEHICLCFYHLNDEWDEQIEERAAAVDQDEVQQLQYRLENSEKGNDGLSQLINSLEHEIEQKNAQIFEVQEANHLLEGKIMHLEVVSTTQDSDSQRVDELREKLRSNGEEWYQDLEEAERDQDNSRRRNSALRNKIELVCKQRDNFEIKYKIVRDQLVDDSSLENLQKENAFLEGELEESQILYSQTIHQHGLLSAEQDTMFNENVSLQTLLDLANQRSEGLQKQLDDDQVVQVRLSSPEALLHQLEEHVFH